MRQSLLINLPCRYLTISKVTIREIGTKFISTKNQVAEDKSVYFKVSKKSNLHTFGSASS
jgi:hypothetical protein